MISADLTGLAARLDELRAPDGSMKLDAPTASLVLANLHSAADGAVGLENRPTVVDLRRAALPEA
jgi:hypothetical protein